MISISYTITPAMTDHLVAIDSYRRLILTTPLSPVNERKLRWTAVLGHITGSLAVSGTVLPKSHIITLLTHPPKHPTSPEQLVLSYRQALDWITETWSANPKSVTLSVLETLATMITAPHRENAAFQDEEAGLRHLLTYLQSQSDHPILLAGITQGLLASSSLDTRTKVPISLATTTLILAKYGYDCRGLLALDHWWAASRDRYGEAMQSINRLGQLTAWLEYYTAIAESAYEHLAMTVSQAGVGVVSDLPAATWQLTSREEQIIRRLDSPTTRITNRDVQHSFRVSQVTASRNLTRLASLGLLYTHGKGRSVYYTKA